MAFEAELTSESLLHEPTEPTAIATATATATATGPAKPTGAVPNNGAPNNSVPRGGSPNGTGTNNAATLPLSGAEPTVRVRWGVVRRNCSSLNNLA